MDYRICSHVCCCIYLYPCIYVVYTHHVVVYILVLGVFLELSQHKIHCLRFRHLGVSIMAERMDRNTDYHWQR